jgi:hypothetical protein
MEKLGIEKSQLITELQSQYSRLIHRQNELVKISTVPPTSTPLHVEIEQIKMQLDALLEE